MILSAQQITSLRQRNERELSLGARSAHGYPKETILDLLETLDEMRVSKKKWQRLATHRGELLGKIGDMAALVKDVI